MFGAYISNSCDQRLGKTKYDFDDEDAKAAADEFTKQLYELDEALKVETSFRKVFHSVFQN